MPADEHWLARLLARLRARPTTSALAYGPYRPRPGAPARRARASSTAGSPRWRPTAARAWTAPRRRAGRAPRRSSPTPTAPSPARAWERVPFREVPYAEDQALALDMLRAGFAKAYVPDAAVVHSHEYATARAVPPLVRRVARPARGARLGRAGARPCATLLTIQSRVRADVRSLRGAACRRGTLVPRGARARVRHWTRPRRRRGRRLARRPAAAAPCARWLLARGPRQLRADSMHGHEHPPAAPARPARAGSPTCGAARA